MKQLEKDLEYTLKKLDQTELDKFKNSTILITGCGGFIGYFMMNFFKKYCDELNIKKVIALDNFMLGEPKWLDKFKTDPHFELRKFNIISDNVEEIESAKDADYIIHMASIASPVFYRKYPIETLDANIWGMRRLFDFYKDKAIKGFLFFSSSETYGNPDKEHIPTDESYNGNVAFTGPRSCYDESKRFGETMCMLFAQQYQMPIGVVRPFNNYGPGMRIGDRRVPADFAYSILKGQDIVILSDGSPTRTFCYIADAVTGYFKILLSGKYDFFNIGIDKPEISIKELADIYVRNGNKIYGYDGKVVLKVSEDKNYLVNNPQRRCPNIDKARKILNYNPEIQVTEGVERFLTYLKEENNGEYEW